MKSVNQMLLERHSRSWMLRIVKWIGNDPEKFDALMAAFFSRDILLAQRAAWPFSYAARQHPALARKHMGKLIANLDRHDLHPATIRNSFRFLQEASVPQKYLGRLTDTAFRYMKDASRPAAIRVFAMTTVLNIAKLEPGLGRELEIVVKDMMEEKIPSIIARGKKTMAVLSRLKEKA